MFKNVTCCLYFLINVHGVKEEVVFRAVSFHPMEDKMCDCCKTTKLETNHSHETLKICTDLDCENYAIPCSPSCTRSKLCLTCYTRCCRKTLWNCRCHSRIKPIECQMTFICACCRKIYLLEDKASSKCIVRFKYCIQNICKQCVACFYKSTLGTVCRRCSFDLLQSNTTSFPGLSDAIYCKQLALTILSDEK